MLKATRLRATRLLLLASALIAAPVFALAPAPSLANEFVFDERTNQEMATRLGIPVYFTVPESARAPLPKSIDTTDRLIDFRHPEAVRWGARLGLRVIVAKRDGLAARLAQSGLVQT